MERTLKNKKGVSMIELIAYVALYGVVMSLFASMVFVIIRAAQKVDAQAIINRGSTIMYTEILAQTIALNPDTVSPVTTSEDGNTISVTFTKRFYYNDEGERKPISENTEYQNKAVSIKYSYIKNSDNISVLYTMGNGTTSSSAINLDFNMRISSHDSDDISNVFSVDAQNSSNKYVTFHGDLHYSDKKMEFNFIVPVFTAKED